jgi:mRNA interferase RelE/StbE
MIWVCNLSRSAEKQLAKLPQDIKLQIIKALEAMEHDPLTGDVIPLKGKGNKGRYRLRVGRYRLIFTINHQQQFVFISAILKRDEKTYK